MARRRRFHGDPVKKVEDLGNMARNERQKSQLLCEVSTARRGEIEITIENSRKIVEASKELCQRAAADAKRRRQPG